MECQSEADDVTCFPADAADDQETLQRYTYVGLPEETLWGLGALCTLTTLLSVVGNISVIVVLTVGKRSRTDLSKFLINLALADLVMAIFCMPFTFTTALNSNQWIFGRPMCTLVLYMQTASVTASVVTSTTIAVDRYLAITRPLRAKAVVTVHGPILAGIWTVSFATAAVQLFVARTETVDIDPDLQLTVCQEDWPEPKQSWTRGYTIFVFVVTYLFPLNVIALTYVIVCRKLWTRKCPGNADHARDSNQLRSTRKIVKMLVAVVAMFGVCWLPLHLFTIHQDIDGSRAPPSHDDNDTWDAAAAAAEAGPTGEDDGDADDRRFAVFMMVHWLAMSNSFVNPIIYGFLNDAFRSDLKHLASSFLSAICCRRRRRGSPNPPQTTEPGFTLQMTDSDQNSSARSSKDNWTLDADTMTLTVMTPAAAAGSKSLAVATRTSRGWRPVVSGPPPNHRQSDLTYHHQRHHQRVQTDPQRGLILTFLDDAMPAVLTHCERLGTADEDNNGGIEEAKDVE